MQLLDANMAILLLKDLEYTVACVAVSQSIVFVQMKEDFGLAMRIIVFAVSHVSLISGVGLVSYRTYIISCVSISLHCISFCFVLFVVVPR